MEFFNSAVEVLQTLVIALGAGLGIWGVINLLEGYLFSSILSHNCINRETGNKSARLVISKVSKVDYINNSPHFFTI